MVRVGRVPRWSSAALTGVCLAGAACFVAYEVSSSVEPDTKGQATAVPTRAEAEAPLTEAYRLAQAPNHTGLCQAIAQNPVACQKILEWASEAHAMPSAESPSVVGVSTVLKTGDTQGAMVLHIRGTRANGAPYTSDFSAVRAEAGVVRGQNAVYWFSTFGSK